KPSNLKPVKLGRQHTHFRTETLAQRSGHLITKSIH
ncbi:MAG: hypothetical protein RLZZ216_1831, partial [Cyanobacteriota bacterium]